MTLINIDIYIVQSKTDLLQTNIVSDLCESTSQKLRSEVYSMHQEVLNAEQKKEEAMKKRSDLLTELSVMMNTSAKFKTEETKSFDQLQAALKEKDQLEKQAMYDKNIDTVQLDINYGAFRTESDTITESYVQLNDDLQKVNVMVSCR